MVASVLKFFFKLALCFVVAGVVATVSPGLPLHKHFLFAIAIVFVAPHLYSKWKAERQTAGWKRDAELARADRADAEEHAHQTALRRERERMEMHAEMRVKELIATLEVQFRIDARKMEQLAQMKAEFAGRQQADMASLLGRLEAMKAGA